MGRRFSLVVVLLSAVLPAAAASAADAPSAPAAPAAAAAARSAAPVRGAETLLGGWALVAREARLRGATVRVTTLDGRPLDRGAVRTTRWGTFELRLRGTPPRRFVVVATGGRAAGRPFRGRLRAVVERARRGALVHLTPATTVAAAVYARASRAGLAAAERKTRRILSLPRGGDLGSGPRRDSAAFDGRRFLAAARAGGGFDRYARAVARRALRGGRPLRFRARGRAAATSRAQAASADSGIAQAIMTALLDGLVEGPEDDAIGWVLDGIGFGGNDDNQLDAIERQLDDLVATTHRIEQEVLALRTQVAQLQAELTQGTYDELVASFPAGDVGSADDQVLTDLSWLVEHAEGDCAPGALADCVGAIPSGQDPSGWCASAQPKTTQFQKVACDALLLIASKQYDDVLGEATDIVSGSAGSRGLIDVYGAAQYASIAASFGFVTGDYAANALAVYQHFAAVQALLADYLAQYWNAEGQPTDLQQTKLAAVESEIGAQAAQVPTPLPEGVAIEAGDAIAWGLARSPSIPVSGDGVGSCFPVDSNWMWSWQLADPVCDQWRLIAYRSTGGVTGWMLPLVDDLAGLPGGLPTLATLTQQMRLPDVSADAADAPLPPPNTSFPSGVGPIVGDWYPNPGTALGLMTGNCSAHVTWNSGLSQSGDGWDSPVFAQGTFCSYVDLRSGTRRIECVAGDPGYYGCDMAVSRSATNRIGRSSGALDYGHPTAVLLWRPLDGSEGWVRR